MREEDVRRYVNNEFKHHQEVHKMDREQLQTQAKEYQRRLDELNHAHERSQENKAEFVNINLYRQAMRELTDNFNESRKILDKTQNATANNTRDISNLQANILWISRTIFGTLIGAIVLGLLSIIIRGLRGE